MLNISNYYEQLVTDQLWQITQSSQEGGQAISQGFIEDVACLALNKLPPCYVRNPVDKGANLSDFDYQEMTDAVSQAIAEAITIVRLQPHDVRDA